VFGWVGVLRLVDFGTAWCGRSREQSERRSGGSEVRDEGYGLRKGPEGPEGTDGMDGMEPEEMGMESGMVCEVGTG
jgi:hypothetical protein